MSVIPGDSRDYHAPIGNAVAFVGGLIGGIAAAYAAAAPAIVEGCAVSEQCQQTVEQAASQAEKAAEPAVQFSQHALDRMTQRGVAMEQVQTIMNNIKPFQYFHDGVWKTGYYDPVSKIFVGQVQELVTTVITNVKPQYIENLQAATP